MLTGPKTIGPGESQSFLELPRDKVRQLKMNLTKVEIWPKSFRKPGIISKSFLENLGRHSRGILISDILPSIIKFGSFWLCMERLASPDPILAIVNLWIESWWPVASVPTKSCKSNCLPGTKFNACNNKRPLCRNCYRVLGSTLQSNLTNQASGSP